MGLNKPTQPKIEWWWLKWREDRDLIVPPRHVYANRVPDLSDVARLLWAGHRMFCGREDELHAIADQLNLTVRVGDPIYAIYPQPIGRGPNGRKLCRWCHGEVPKRKRSWCSDECLHQYRCVTDWNYIRAQVYERDQGICQHCGVNIEQMEQWWRRIRQSLNRLRPREQRIPSWRRDSEIADALVKIGLPDQHNRSWWEVDHVVARRDGGSDHPDNCRLLCTPCHKSRTAKQRKDWSKRRKEAV